MGLKRVPDVKIQRILWLGVFIAPLTMGWILTQIIEKPEGLVTASLSLTRSSIIPDFKDIFFYFALFQLFAAFSIPKIIRAKAKMLQGLADASAQVQGMNFIAFVIQLSMLESISILGVFLAMRSQNISDFVPYAFFSMFCILFLFPREDQLSVPAKPIL